MIILIAILWLFDDFNELIRPVGLFESIKKRIVEGSNDFYLDRIEFIDNKTLRFLSFYSHNLSLNGLKSLTDSQAEILSHHEGNLALNGISELSETQAKWLGKHQNTIQLAGLKSVSEKSAFFLVEHCHEVFFNSLELNQIKKFEKSFKSGNSCKLHFDGIIYIDYETAKIFKHHQGHLSFNKLLTLSDNSLNEIVENKAIELSLNGIKEISISQATILANTECGISLGALTNLSDQIFLELGKAKGQISFDSIKILPDTQIALLKKIGPNLRFDNLSRITSDIFGYYNRKGGFKYINFPQLKSLRNFGPLNLEKFNGELELNGIEELSEQDAIFLGRTSGFCKLNGVKNINDKISMALFNQIGSLHLDGLKVTTSKELINIGNHFGSISMDGLVSINDEIAICLGKHFGGLSLCGLTKISDKQSEFLAKKLPIDKDNFFDGTKSVELNQFIINTNSTYDFDLSNKIKLNGISFFSDTQINNLSKSLLSLEINGLKKLSISQCKSLANHKNWLFLDGVEELGDQESEFLFKHQGRLSLDGLKKISDKQAFCISQRKQGIFEELFLINVNSISDLQAEILSSSPCAVVYFPKVFDISEYGKNILQNNKNIVFRSEFKIN